MGYQTDMIPEAEQVPLVLAEPLDCLCCSAIIPAGDTITIYGYHKAQPGTKKRRTCFIWHHAKDNRSGHNVRMSHIKAVS